MAHHGTAAARGNQTPAKANPKKEAAAAPSSNVIPFPVWHIPVPTLADSNTLDCACDIIAIGGNIASTVFDAEFDYEKEMAELGMNMLSTLQSSFEDSGKASDAPPESFDTIVMHQTSTMLDLFEACSTANLRLTRRLYESNMAALEALIALPRHFCGLK